MDLFRVQKVFKLREDCLRRFLNSVDALQEVHLKNQYVLQQLSKGNGTASEPS